MPLLNLEYINSLKESLEDIGLDFGIETGTFIYSEEEGARNIELINLGTSIDGVPKESRFTELEVYNLAKRFLTTIKEIEREAN